MADTGKSMKIQVLETIAALMTAAFGFVAALAWNGAIVATIAKYMDTGDGLDWIVCLCNSRHHNRSDHGRHYCASIRKSQEDGWREIRPLKLLLSSIYFFNQFYHAKSSNSHSKGITTREIFIHIIVLNGSRIRWPRSR